jgi:hypothetical protein
VTDMELEYTPPEKKTKLGNGWRMGEPYTGSKQAEFVKRMYEETMEQDRRAPPKPLPVFTSEEEKQAHILAMQQPSTKANLERQKTRKEEEDLDWVLRSMADCIAKPEAKSLDELTGKRALDPADVVIIEDIRRKGRNRRGESKASSVDKAKRERGIHAFTYSEPYAPTLDEMKRLKRLNPMDAVSPEIAPKKLKKHIGFWDWYHDLEFRFWRWWDDADTD